MNLYTIDIVNRIKSINDAQKTILPTGLAKEKCLISFLGKKGSITLYNPFISTTLVNSAIDLNS